MILKVSDLNLAIGESQILNGIELNIKPGETVGIIGPNGSGITTLFNCISGFVSPQKGSVLLKDKNITHLRPHQRAELGLGRVFQNFGIFREMTVGENLVTAIESRQSPWATFFPWSKQNRVNREAAREYLKDVSLDQKFDDKAGSLSGGQMRLLEIVRTLAFGAELFLLDEPTAGVSPKMKGDVSGLIRKLQKLNRTVLIIEHDINFIQEFCDRIVVLDSGRVVLESTPLEVKDHPVVREIYFGSGKNGNGRAEKQQSDANVQNGEAKA